MIILKSIHLVRVKNAAQKKTEKKKKKKKKGKKPLE